MYYSEYIMKKNKGILFVLVSYILSFIYLLAYFIQFINTIVLSRPSNLPFLFFPEGFTIIVFTLLLIVIACTIYGILNTKRWGYKLGVILAILSLPSFILIFLSKSTDYVALLFVVNGVILFINRKSLK
jgi:hypothetical protein